MWLGWLKRIKIYVFIVNVHEKNEIDCVTRGIDLKAERPGGFTL